MKATRKNCNCEIVVSNGKRCEAYWVNDFGDKAEFTARVAEDFPGEEVSIVKIDDWAGAMLHYAYQSQDYGDFFNECDYIGLGETEDDDFHLDLRYLPEDFFALNDVIDGETFALYMDSLMCDDGYVYSSIAREVEFFNEKFVGYYNRYDALKVIDEKCGLNLARTLRVLGVDESELADLVFDKIDKYGGGYSYHAHRELAQNETYVEGLGSILANDNNMYLIMDID